MKDTQSIQPEVKGRRKLLTGIGLLSLFPLFKLSLFSKKNPAIYCAPPPEKEETMKLLSQNGQLVEVDISKIKARQGKISDEELQGWIKKQ